MLTYGGHPKEEPIVKIKHVIPYEKKYIEQYNLLDEVPLTKEKIDSLTNNFIMDLTPIGNVVMCYDSDKESFLYYSDNVVPYRFLEALSRKYVVTFSCKSLYVNMEEQLDDTTPEVAETTTIVKPKKTKDIIASLKNPPKPQSHQQQQQHHQPSKKVKVRANRYSSMGRFSNFKIIKPVEKKLVVENYTMTFSDFKKLNANKTSV
jgi:hypothetical protein